MNTKKMNTLPWSDALCKPNQMEAYVRSYPIHWQELKSNCFCLEYSYNQLDWYRFNGGNPIQLPLDDIPLLPEFPQYDHFGITIPITLLEKLKKIYGAPEPIWLSKIEDIKNTMKNNNSIRPSKILVEYTNGMQESRFLDWNGNTATIREPKYSSPFIKHRADPFICTDKNGYYYFTASYTDMKYNSIGSHQYLYIILRKSKSLIDLADNSNNYNERIILTRKPINNGISSPHIWAPELHYINNKWYIYYSETISSESSWKIRPHCLECQGHDPMCDNWIEKGPLHSIVKDDIAFTDFSLDHTFFHHNDRNYISWAQKTNNISDIFIAELINPWTLGTPSTLLTHPEFNWENHGFAVNEGSSFIKHNDKIFLTFSASGTDATYCIGLLSADSNSNLLDSSSWHKYPYPVFQSSVTTNCYGPGHNSFTKSSDGIDDLIVYHARNDAKYLGEENYQPLYDAGRNTYIGKIFWNLDGTPSFSIPGASIAHDPNHLIITL